MDIVEKLRGRSEYERHLGVELIYLYHTDVENICNEIERLREALSFYADKQNYIEVKNSTVFVPIITVDFKPEVDNGRTARAALQQKESE